MFFVNLKLAVADMASVVVKHAIISATMSQCVHVVTLLLCKDIPDV